MVNTFADKISNPNIGAGAINAFAAGRQFRNQEQDRTRKIAAEDRATRQKNALLDARKRAISGQSGALADVAGLDPKEAQEIQKFMQTATDQDREAARHRNETIFRHVAPLAQLPKEELGEALLNTAETLLNEGIDVTNQLDGITSDNILQKVGAFAARAVEVKDLMDQFKPQSTVGKVREDERRGFISEADANAAVSGTSKPSAMDRKIQAIMQTQGVDQRTATGLATGTLKPITNPVTGITELVDLTTGVARPLVGDGQSQGDASPVPDEDKLFNRTTGVAGVPGAIVEGAQATLGQAFDLGPGAAEITQNRTAFRAATRSLVRALANNPRFPVAEMNAIRKEIAIEPAIMDNERALQARMAEIDDVLSNRIAQNLRTAGDPSLPAKQRADARQAAVEMQNFLETLGVPDDFDPTVQQDAQSIKDGIKQRVLQNNGQ